MNILYAEVVNHNQIDFMHRIHNLNSAFYQEMLSTTNGDIRRQIVRQKIESVEKEIELLVMKNNSDKVKLQVTMLEIKKNIKNIERDKKNCKNLFKSFAKEQKIYYLDILKKGIDVRDEGLVWVVKRLIELNSQIDYASFPRFLDNSQMDYLLTVRSIY